MSMIQFLIDSGYSIPRFCYHGLLSVAGNCRVCIIDDRELKISVSCSLCYESYILDPRNCNALVGLYVKTALLVREHIFEFLLLSHPLDCPICDRGGECELQDMTNSFGSDRGRHRELKSTTKDKLFNVSVSTHMSRCITCGRCVRFLREVVHSFNLGITGRGNMSEIGNYDSSVGVYKSLFSSNVVDLCPVTVSVVLYNLSATEYTYIMVRILTYRVFIVALSCYELSSYVPSKLLGSVYFCRLYFSLPITYASRKLLDDVYECVLCASCTAACPSYWWNSNSYLGPAVLLQAYRWIVGSSDSNLYERLNILDIGYNISLCHGIENCKVVCPKNLDPAGRISDIKSILGFSFNKTYYI